MKTKEEICEHLQQIAYLFLKAKEQWRSRAFSNAVGMLRMRQGELTFNEDGKLTDQITGVGDAIKTVIEQFNKTGTSDKLNKLREMLPNEIVERFNAKTAKQKVNKLLEPLADKGVKWQFAGSLRRGLKTVKDVDVVVTLKDDDKEKAIVRKLIEDAGLKVDVRDGETKWGISIPVVTAGRSFTLDLNFCHEENEGAYLLYFTGSKALNIDMRGLAKRKGMLLNDKGLFRGDVCVASKTEREIFEALEMAYIEPEKREGGLKAER